MGVLGNNAKTRLQKGTKNFNGISGYLNNDIPHDNPVEVPDPDKRVTEPQGDQNNTLEFPNPHVTTASQIVGQEKICEKIPLKTPENQVQSSIKNMQTEIEKVTEKISKYMNSITSYTDAVTFESESSDFNQGCIQGDGKIYQTHHGSNDGAHTEETKRRVN